MAIVTEISWDDRVDRNTNTHDNEADTRLPGNTSANALTCLSACQGEYEGATACMTL